MRGRPGEYLVDDVSAGGARLVGGPLVGAGVPARILLRLVGLPCVRLNAVVVRTDACRDGGAAIAFSFRNVPAQVQADINRTVVESLQRSRRPAVLVADPDVTVLARMVDALGALGHRSILAFRPSEAMRFLTQPCADVGVALVGMDQGSVRGDDLLELIRRRSPGVHGALMAARSSADAAREADRPPESAPILSLPPRPGRLGAVIGAAPNAAPAEEGKPPRC